MQTGLEEVIECEKPLEENLPLSFTFDGKLS